MIEQPQDPELKRHDWGEALTFLDFQDPGGSRCQLVFLLDFNRMSPLVILTFDLFHMEESLPKGHALTHVDAQIKFLLQNCIETSSYPT